MEMMYRAIRAGVSIFLCLVVVNLFKLKYPFFVCIPAVMLMATSASVIKSGENRIYGTIIGAVIGTILIFSGPLNPLASGIGVIVIIYVCNFIKRGTSSAIAGLIFVTIMVGIKVDNPIIYSLYRTFDTLVGIVITIIVNEFMFYFGVLSMLNKRCAMVKNKIYNIARDVAMTSKKINFEGLSREVEEINDQIDEYRMKKFISTEYRNKIHSVVDVVSVLNLIYEHLKMISVMDIDYELNKKNCKEFNDTFKCNRKFISYNESTDNVVFNYHYEKILSGVKEINILQQENGRA